MGRNVLNRSVPSAIFSVLVIRLDEIGTLVFFSTQYRRISAILSSKRDA
jgi:hypothetical protein